MTGDLEDLIQYRILRSSETLREAETMIQNKFWNAAIMLLAHFC